MIDRPGRTGFGQGSGNGSANGSSADPWNDPRQLRPRLRFTAPADAEAVAALYTEAFGDDAEARLVAQLDEDQDLLFTIVAEREGLAAPEAQDPSLGALVGAVSFSRVTLDDAARDAPLPCAALAPIAVALPLRGRGIGAALIRTGLMHCRKRGIAAVLVLGDPKLYIKTGFSVAAAAKIEAPWSGPHFMAQPLIDGLGMLRGKAQYGAAFGAM